MNEWPDRPTQKDARRREVDRKLRLAFLEGAEKHSRQSLGRGLTHDELRRVIGRFPAAVSGR